MFEILSNKKTLVAAGFFQGFKDFHSHILPTVDDGIKSVNRAIEFLLEYERLGVKKVVFTPHIMETYPENNAQYLRSIFEKFTSLYNGNIELHLAAEYMLDYTFSEHIESGDILTLCDNYILVETSCLSPTINLLETIREIKSRGYFVILAHPERYVYMNDADFVQLKNDGVLFQLNLLALLGHYGKHVEGVAKRLLKNRMYNIIGSDIHNMETFINSIQRIKITSKQIDILKTILNNSTI